MPPPTKRKFTCTLDMTVNKQVTEQEARLILAEIMRRVDKYVNPITVRNKDVYPDKFIVHSAE